MRLRGTFHSDILVRYHGNPGYKWEAMGSADVAGRSGMYCMDKDRGFIAWLDVVPVILYNLCMEKGANQEILQNLAETVFVPLQGEAK